MTEHKGDIRNMKSIAQHIIQNQYRFELNQVLSGSEWGNMLLWDGGLIQIEVCRKKGKPCHNGSIQQILLHESDIFTVGEDGYIRVWDFETIDTAEAVEEGGKMEIEPLNELKVGTDSKLMGITHGADNDMALWFAQDANGNVWKLDLSFSKNSLDPEIVQSFMSGAITGLDVSTSYDIFAASAGNSVRIMHTFTQDVLAQRIFNKKTTSLKWIPSAVDEKSDGIFLGFEDGVVRFVRLRSVTNKSEKKLDFDIRLSQVIKPHTKSVTCIALEVSNRWVATGSADGTVFFFNFSPKGLTPIGFVNTKNAVTYMTWTPSHYAKPRLMVCLNNGTVLEYDAPTGRYDATTSYSIESQLAVRIFKFRSIKSKLRHEEELERKRKEEEERQKKLEEERRLRGIEKKDKDKEGKEGTTTTGTTEEEEEEQKQEDEWKPYIPEIPSQALFGIYTSPDTFWLSMDDYDAGYLYHCQFSNKDDRFQYSEERQDTVISSLPVPNTDLAHGEDIPLTCILVKEDTKMVFVGLKNGFIRVYPYVEKQIFGSLDTYWTMGSHDSEYGSVTHLSMSFDNRFALSGGIDGNIFGYVVKGDLDIFQQRIPSALAPIRMPSQTTESEPQDIVDPQHYSIEEDKQKAEKDKMMYNAESLKKEMRNHIEALRTKFRNLLMENEQLPGDLKMARKEFILDEKIRNNLQIELQEKIDQSTKELAWESERCNIASKKLEQWFLEPVAQDTITVKSFDNQWEVSTFRTVALPTDFDNLREEIDRQKMALLEKMKSKDIIETVDGRGVEQKTTQMAETKATSSKLKGAKALRVERLLRKVEERSKRRQIRKDEWTALNNKKVPVGYDDPTEVENIRLARVKMGNYFLKTALDYVVPPDQRLTVLKSLDRIMKLKLATYTYQMKFNYRVTELQQRKRSIITFANDEFQRIQQLGQNAQTHASAFIIKRLPLSDDGSQSRFEFTKEEIQAFREDYEQHGPQLSRPDDDGTTGHRASTIRRTIDNRWSVLEIPTEIKTSAYDNMDKQATVDDLKKIKNVVNSTPPSTNDTSNGTSNNPFVHRLFFERDKILEHVQEIMHSFDNDVCLLYYLKMIKTLRVKENELRHITMYEELMLMKEFERTENDLENKVSEAQQRFSAEQIKINEFQQKIDLKKKDIDQLDDRMKHLYAKFDDMIPKEHKFYNYLLRVLNKKIKRKKKVEGEDADDNQDTDSQDFDEDEEDWELDDEDGDDALNQDDPTRQLDVDICPPNLDQKVYDDIIALREKRLDIDEATTEEKTVLQTLQQGLGQTQSYSSKVEIELKGKQSDLTDFQKKKQRKINDINVAFGLRTHQIRYDRSSRLPDDIAQALIFNTNEKIALQNRIVDVKTEIKKEKERHENKVQTKKDLSHELKHLVEVIKRLTDECNKLMIEKFGKLVNLEKLEGAIVNLQIEELKQRLDDAGDEYYNSMQQFELKKMEEKDDTIDLLKTNTQRLHELATLVDDKRRIDDQLMARKMGVAEEYAGPTKRNVEEFDRLCTLVQLQAQEIEALKAEISILSRKGGHILPPNPALLPQNV